MSLKRTHRVLNVPQTLSIKLFSLVGFATSTWSAVAFEAWTEEQKITRNMYEQGISSQWKPYQRPHRTSIQPLQTLVDDEAIDLAPKPGPFEIVHSRVHLDACTSS